MTNATTKEPRGGWAAQLMVSAQQEAQFGEAGILSTLETVLATLELRELMLSIHNPEGVLARKIVELLHHHAWNRLHRSIDEGFCRSSRAPRFLTLSRQHRQKVLVAH